MFNLINGVGFTNTFTIILLVCYKVFCSLKVQCLFFCKVIDNCALEWWPNFYVKYAFRHAYVIFCCLTLNFDTNWVVNSCMNYDTNYIWMYKWNCSNKKKPKTKVIFLNMHLCSNEGITHNNERVTLCINF